MAISDELRELLVCPLCKGRLEGKGQDGLVCPACRKVYRIKDGIPAMIAEEAETL